MHSALSTKKIKWEVQFHKTAQKLRDIEVKGNAPSLDWIIGARWALNNMIQKENKKMRMRAFVFYHNDMNSYCRVYCGNFTWIC